MDIGLLLLRTAVGLTLAAHGAQKLFGWFGGPGLDKTGASFAGLGFVPGRRHALMAGLTEAGGGLLLAMGLATPLATSAVLAVMLVAAVSVHVRQGFFLTNGGYEYTLILGLSGLSVAFTGPGRFSLDALLGLQFDGALWGAAALLLGAAGAAIQLSARKPRPVSLPAAA
jgi:putative oxidoreductase